MRELLEAESNRQLTPLDARVPIHTIEEGTHRPRHTTAPRGIEPRILAPQASVRSISLRSYTHRENPGVEPGLGDPKSPMLPLHQFSVVQYTSRLLVGLPEGALHIWCGATPRRPPSLAGGLFRSPHTVAHAGLASYSRRTGPCNDARGRCPSLARDVSGSRSSRDRRARSSS